VLARYGAILPLIMPGLVPGIHVLGVSRKKAILEAAKRCAAAGLRSVNAEIEILLREALARRGIRIKTCERRRRRRLQQMTTPPLPRKL